MLTTDGAGTVSFAHPQTIAENVKNVSGGILYKGTPVHVTGSVGNLAEVIAADAATNYPAHFVLNEDLNDDEEGLGIALGFINNVDVFDASIYTEGQTVYLGAAGGWVTSKPTGASNAIQNLGIIIKVNTGGNKISGIVMGAGRANDVPNIATGNIWAGNSSGVATATDTAYIDIANSRVGIGTTSPSEKLEVNGAVKITNVGAAQLILRGDSNNVGDTGEVDGIIDFLHDDGLFGYRLNTENHSGKSALNIQEHINGSRVSRLYINNDGNVGIGTITPQALLQVGSVTSSVYSLTAGNADIIAVNKDISDTQMGTLNVTSKSKRSSSPFNQGYGPSITFTQNGSGYVDGYEKVIGGIKTEIKNATNLNFASLMQFYTHNNSSLSVGMTIDGSAGNVGIGTTSPNEKLHLYNNGDVGIRLQNQADTSGNTWRLWQDNWDGANTFTFNIDYGSTNIIKAKTDGNVGIGTTSPSAKLDVSGEIQTTSGGSFGTDGVSASIFMNTTDNRGLSGRFTTYARNLIKSDGSATIEIGENSSLISLIKLTAGSSGVNGVVSFLTKNLERMRVAPDGNVGIGTTAPTFANGSGLEIERAGIATLRLQDTTNVANVELQSGESGLHVRVGANGSSGNLFNVSSAGTSRLLIDISGNVGIGTTSPDTELHIADNNPFLTLRGSNASYSNAGIQLISGYASNQRALGVFHYIEDSDVEWFAGLPYSSNDAYVINRNANYTVPSSQSSPRGKGASEGRLLTINSSGNVGIGTTSPSEKLYVVGNIYSSGNITANGNINATSYLQTYGIFYHRSNFYVLNKAANSWLTWVTRSTSEAETTIQLDYVRSINASNGGNVGIGTTSPSAKLDVSGEIQTTSGGSFGTDGTTASIFMNTTANRGLSGRFSTYARNLIKSDGSATIEIGENSSLISLIKLNAGSSGVNGVVSFLTKNSERMRVAADGNVGIGTTSPSYNLDVQGATNGIIRAYGGTIGRLSLQNSTRHYSTSVQGSNWLFYDETGGAERLRITSAGNVGIGTTSPSSKLHIETNDSIAARIIGANASSYTSMLIGNTATGAATLWLDAANGDLSGSDYTAIRQNNDLTLELFCSPLAGDLIMTLGGTERMRVKTDGNVGIGTTSPASTLDVNGAITLSGDIEHTIQRLTTSNITSASTHVTEIKGRQIDLYAYDDIWLRAGSTDNIGFEAGGFTRMYINSDGNVGIGTSSPLYPFSVESDTTGLISRIYNTNTDGQGLLIRAGSTSSPTRVLQVASSNDTKIMTVNSNGKVGIGTNNPAYSLSVNGDIQSNVIRGYGLPSQNIILLEDDNLPNQNGVSLSSVGSMAFHIDVNNNSSNDSFDWKADDFSSGSATSLMRLTDEGNLGIGTTSPGAKLHIVGANSNSEALYLFGDSNYGATIRYDRGGSYGWRAGVGGGSSSSTIPSSYWGIEDSSLGISRLVVAHTTGNVGIGTSNPRTKLHVSGLTGDDDPSLGASTAPLFVSNTANSYGLNVGVNNAGDAWLQAQSNTAAIAYDILLNPLGGNVGIGTTTPSEKLDVVGNVRVNGKVEADSVTIDDEGLSAAGDYGKGAEVWYQGTGATSAGYCYYLDSSGNWASAQANAVGTAQGMLAVSAGTDSDVDGMVLRGFVQIGNALTGSVGDAVYLSESSAGRFTTTKPTGAGNFVRRVGYLAKGTNVIYFNPSNEYEAL